MPESNLKLHADDWPQTISEYLADTDGGTASLDELVDHVIEHEPNAVATDRETVTYEIVRVCLPTLAENELIAFNERTETIEYTPSKR